VKNTKHNPEPISHIYIERVRVFTQTGFEEINKSKIYGSFKLYNNEGVYIFGLRNYHLFCNYASKH
jgi:hypothetical protein